MSLKDMEKKQQTPAKKEAKNTSTRPWPDLPHQIASQSTLEPGINFRSVTKSWRAAPKKCNPNAVLPWLQISNTNTSKGDQQQCNLTDPWPPYRAPRYPWKYYLGCTNGILVAKGSTSSTYILWDILLKDHSIVYLYGYEWIKQDCSLIDPHATDKSQKHYMQFTNAIGFRGKFYILNLQGTLAVIEVDSHLKITSLGTRRAIPSVSLKHLREYLEESDGEILLIFLISKKSTNVVDDVEIFQLDLVRLSWTKMECLGDQTLFVGCKRNCLYFHFSHNTIHGWWLYDMKSDSISLQGGVTTILGQSPVWDEPEWMSDFVKRKIIWNNHFRN
ncbi:hypothetical protein ACB092_12G196700 [Castanea dentata]